MQFQSQENKARLDKHLSELSGSSRNQVGIWIKNGQLKVNGKKITKAGFILHKNDIIYVSELKGNSPAKHKAENIKLDIIFENKDFIVINKDAGIVVHPDSTGHSDGTVVNALLHYMRMEMPGNDLRPCVVHRLDKDTSGVLILAKNTATLGALAAEFKNRNVTKEYLALVEGHLPHGKITIDAAIRRDSKLRTRMAINKNGRNAVTHIETIEKFQDSSLVKVNIETGRTHQIRLHLASLGCPILGDARYGNMLNNKVFKDKYGLSRQFLHAHKLEIQGFKFEAKLKKDLEECLGKIRKDKDLINLP